MSSGYPPPPNMSMIGDKRKKKRPSNTGSKLLDNQENYFLFSILGNDNICLSAAVVELLSCEDRHWRRKLRGVLCLVKDYVNRAYFLRIYNLISSNEIWSFKLFNGFQVEVGENCPELIFFESQDRKIYGFNFSSVDEAKDFKVHFDKRREQENKSSNKGSAPLPPSSSPYTPSSVRAPSIPLSGGVTPLGIMPHTDKTNSSLGSSLFRKDKGKKKGKNKIRKEDISNPTNFQHKAHVGWDQDSGFSNNVFDSDPMDESIRDIIKAAGQDPSNMSKKTIKFVYDFIDKYQAEEYTETPMAQAQAPYKTPPPSIPVAQPAIAQWSQPTPPPPPSRLSSHQSSMPPARPPPPPPSYLDSSSRAARPLPQVPSIPSQIDANRPAVVPPPPPPPPPVAPTYNNSSSAPPPPPPPPPPILSNTGAVPPPPPPSVLKDLPAPQAARSNLLAEIQAGKKLKSVGEPAEKAGSSNSRGDMMAQIRQGTQLKHVDKMAEEERRKSAAPLSDMGGLAGALAKALEERRVNLGIDDSSDEEDSDDKNEWSD